ncbi:hypothetical protein D3C86_671160 [compost metagenome]
MVNTLIENPKNVKKIKVPMIETGMANTGINVARQLWRKKNTTNVTNTNASIKVCTTPSIDIFTTVTVS